MKAVWCSRMPNLSPWEVKSVGHPCRGMVGATPESVREMFSAGMTAARPETAVLAASDDEDLDAEYRAKQPKGPFVSPPSTVTFSMRGHVPMQRLHLLRSALTLPTSCILELKSSIPSCLSYACDSLTACK